MKEIRKTKSGIVWHGKIRCLQEFCKDKFELRKIGTLNRGLFGMARSGVYRNFLKTNLNKGKYEI